MLITIIFRILEEERRELGMTSHSFLAILLYSIYTIYYIILLYSMIHSDKI